MEDPDSARAKAQRNVNLWVDLETSVVEGLAAAGAAVAGVQSDIASVAGGARSSIGGSASQYAGDWGAEAELASDLLTAPLAVAEGAFTFASMVVGGVTSAPLRFDAAVQKTADGVVRGDAVTAVEGAGEATVAATEIASAILGAGETAGLTNMVDQAPAVAQKWLMWARPTTAPANGAGLADDAARVVGKVDDGARAAPAPMAEGATGAAGDAAREVAPQLGNKLEYFLGRATGNAHNIERSTQMLRQLERVGLPDTPATRQYLTEHLAGVLRDPSNIVRVQENGRIVRESLLMGPRGGLKFETVWDGARLITGNLFGGR